VQGGEGRANTGGVIGNNPRLATKISKVAGRQWGHIQRVQLLELGAAGSAIDRRIKSGELIWVYPGVYAVGHPRPEAIARAAAAVLACGPEAALSYESAAALWGFRDRWPTRPEVSVPGDRRTPGIRIHCSARLEGRDIRRQRNIRVTSPARTIRDLTPRLSAKQLARAVNEARLHAGLRLEDLREVVARLPWGTAKLRAFLEGEAASAPTRSAFEDEFRRFANRFKLPEPQVNTQVAGYEVDVLFAAERVIVELDGWRYHRDAFESDRERDAATLAAGYVTVRITWRRLTQEPEREAARLLAILAARARVSA
jgi:very-short-patch-repair endonuclease